MHVRKRLRDAVKAALVTGVPAVSGRVGGVRQYTRRTDQVPAIEVSTPSHQHVRISDDGALAHDIDLSITIVHALNNDAEDGCDAIAEAVEAAVYGVQVAPFDVAITGMASAFEAADGAEARAALLTLSFSFRVYADEADPQTVA